MPISKAVPTVAGKAIRAVLEDGTLYLRSDRKPSGRADSSKTHVSRSLAQVFLGFVV